MGFWLVLNSLLECPRCRLAVVQSVIFLVVRVGFEVEWEISVAFCGLCAVFLGHGGLSGLFWVFAFRWE